MSAPMIIDARLKLVLRVLTGVGLIIVYVPLALVMINSFNVDRTFTWPPSGFTLHWWNAAAHSSGARSALWVSIQVGLLATAIALALGTLASLALRRTRFFGRNVVSLLIILPIALPGIVTGIALNNAFRTMLGLELGFFTIVVALVLGTLASMALRRTRFFGRNVVSLLIILPIALPGIVTGLAFSNGFRTILGIPLSLWTIVIAHATFCIVTVFNNVQARFQRLGSNFEQASMDLGAGPFTTFWLITLPMLRSALLAGALLSFGLSFDEIVVTTFTASSQDETLPIWIFSNLFRPNQAPIVNCVAAALVIFSAIPIYMAQRLSGNATEAMTGAR